MPSYRHHELGDLYVKIHVKFPDTISPEVIPALESALPARNAVQKFSKNIHVDEVTLEEPNDRQKRSAATNGDEMDEDDDERPGVQCAQRESW
jgi:DnaJ family protein A protein 2